jgi:hypothetical protein
LSSTRRRGAPVAEAKQLVELAQQLVAALDHERVQQHSIRGWRRAGSRRLSCWAVILRPSASSARRRAGGSALTSISIARARGDMGRVSKVGVFTHCRPREVAACSPSSTPVQRKITQRRAEVLPERGKGGDASAAFASSRASFEALLGKLGGQVSGVLEHAELEQLIDRDGRELLRLLLQDHLDLRAAHEARLDGVTDADGVARRSAERGV